jgi:transcriptional regulator with XRE-family HTH domain
MTRQSLCHEKIIQSNHSIVKEKTEHLKYPDFMGFKQNLRKELDYKDIKVKKLSDKAGVKKGALEMYLGVRESMPPADVAVRIVKALGVTVEYLVKRGVLAEKAFSQPFILLRLLIRYLYFSVNKEHGEFPPNLP